MAGCPSNSTPWTDIRCVSLPPQQSQCQGTGEWHRPKSLTSDLKAWTDCWCSFNSGQHARLKMNGKRPKQNLKELQFTLEPLKNYYYWGPLNPEETVICFGGGYFCFHSWFIHTTIYKFILELLLKTKSSRLSESSQQVTVSSQLQLWFGFAVVVYSDGRTAPCAWYTGL